MNNQAVKLTPEELQYYRELWGAYLYQQHRGDLNTFLDAHNEYLDYMLRIRKKYNVPDDWFFNINFDNGVLIILMKGIGWV